VELRVLNSNFFVMLDILKRAFNFRTNNQMEEWTRHLLDESLCG